MLIVSDIGKDMLPDTLIENILTDCPLLFNGRHAAYMTNGQFF
jgi:hypothetical protein